ncbi:MAG: glycosyltransferase family 4 protein [Deltaproteobacteria bacterium]|nr:glycosyltransferase family 4 protein [Deltaproteobacteria bacterium]
MRKTNVLFTYPQPDFALPPWSVCAQIARHLDTNRFQSFVAAAEDTAGKAGVEGTADVARFPLGSPAQIARSLPRLASFVVGNCIDVVHANEDARSLALGLALSRGTGRPLVVHYHATPKIYRGARRRLLKLGASLAARNVGVSRFIADELSAIGVRRTGFVLNGVDARRFSPQIDGSRIRREYGVAPDDVLVLQLARFWRPKRQEDLVRAMAIALRRAPKLKALLVGWDDPRYDGAFTSYREEVKSLARELGIVDRIIVANARPEAPELHAAADIFAFPSVDDPCALVILEVLASGKPFVGARSGGTPELIDEGVTGLLVPPRAPGDLAEKLVLLANDAGLRRRLGDAARASALKDFPEGNVARGFGEIYEETARR